MKRLIDQFDDHLATAFNEQGILIESGPHPALQGGKELESGRLVQAHPDLLFLCTWDSASGLLRFLRFRRGPRRWNGLGPQIGLAFFFLNQYPLEPARVVPAGMIFPYVAEATFLPHT